MKSSSDGYQIIITNPARKQIQRLSGEIYKRIQTAITSLASIPRPAGCRHLTGYPETYRIRVGDYRIVYVIRDAELLIIVIRIGHRSDVYRAL